MEEKGIYWSFKHDDGSDRLIMADQKSAYQECPEYEVDDPTRAGSCRWPGTVLACGIGSELLRPRKSEDKCSDDDEVVALASAHGQDVGPGVVVGKFGLCDFAALVSQAEGWCTMFAEDILAQEYPGYDVEVECDATVVEYDSVTCNLVEIECDNCTVKNIKKK
jgi:hypothetical protein